MANHVQQHFVPRFLLEKWHSGADGKLTAYRWSHGELRAGRNKARSVAKLEHLYSTRVASGSPNVSIERDFMGPQIDEPAAETHRVLLDTGVRSLTNQQKFAWSRFMVSLLFRGPDVVHKIRQLGKDILLDVLDQSPQEWLDIRGEAPEASLKEWFIKREAAYIEDFGTHALPRLIQAPQFNDRYFLVNRVWASHRLSTAEHDLLIGDRPVVHQGDLDHDFVFALPVAPQQILFIANSRPVIEGILARTDEAIVRMTNEQTVARARDYVFGTDCTQLRFIAKRLAKPRS